MKAPLKEWQFFERVPNAEAIAGGLRDIPLTGHLHRFKIKYQSG
jgi:hypothetical protein